MQKNFKGIYLTQTEETLFRYLHAFKVATYKQIHRDIYPNISFKTVCSRLKALENNHLIEGVINFRLNGREKFVSLTKQAFNEFLKQGDEMRIELQSDKVAHDLVLVDIRQRFMKCNRVQIYKTENEIQTWDLFNENLKYYAYKTLNSDAIATIQFKYNTYDACIEFERAVKSEAKSEYFLRKYFERSDIFPVFIIADSQLIVNRLQRIEKQKFSYKRTKFFYVLKQNFLLDETLQFKNCWGDTIDIDNSVLIKATQD